MVALKGAFSELLTHTHTLSLSLSLSLWKVFLGSELLTCLGEAAVEVGLKDALRACHGFGETEMRKRIQKCFSAHRAQWKSELLLTSLFCFLRWPQFFHS